MSEYSVEHCRERAKFWDDDLRINREKVEKALKEIKYWNDQLGRATRDETEYHKTT
jgi:hypothetical protein